MSAGKRQQVGTAEEIYEASQTRFVAGFISETNLLMADVISTSAEGARLRMARGLELDAAGKPDGGQIWVSVRPERIQITPESTLPCTIDKLVYLGTDTQYYVRLNDGTPMVVRAQNDRGAPRFFAPGDAAALTVDPDAAKMLAD